MKPLYHGTIYEFDSIDVTAGKGYKDFGKGFYVTLLREQAELWADRMARQRKGEKILSVYELDIDAIRANYRYLFFPHYDADWLNFIANSRTGKIPWKGFDCIEGGIANDRVIDMVEGYIAGTVSAEYALQELSKHQPNHQICILNQQAIDKYLHFKEAIKC